MKSTTDLHIKTDLFISSETIVMHPNEGFDLGIMNTETMVKIFANATIAVFNKGEEEFVNGRVLLDNNCEKGVIKLNTKYFKKIGKPERIQISYENNKILISNK